MNFHSNLISDSILVNDAARLINSHGGELAAREIVAEVMRMSLVDDEFAALLIADLLRDDPRFRILENNLVSFAAPDFDARMLSETEFVVFDTETTGSKPGAARMTEIGAFKVRNGEIVDQFESLVNPHQSIPLNIVALTGISDEMVAHAPDFADIAPDWLEFVGDSILVAHNVNFDVGFINYEIGRVYADKKLINDHLCTVRLSRKLLPNLVNHRLHTIAEHYAIPIYNRHRAGGDALATAQIFINFLELLDRKNIRDIAALRLFKAPKSARK